VTSNLDDELQSHREEKAVERSQSRRLHGDCRALMDAEWWPHLSSLVQLQSHQEEKVVERSQSSRLHGDCRALMDAEWWPQLPGLVQFYVMQDDAGGRLLDGMVGGCPVCPFLLPIVPPPAISPPTYPSLASSLW
jgi:hypothetical protein